MLENCGGASSEEQIERLVQAEVDTVRCQNLRQAAATQHFAIDQYAVAVEDDQVGFNHHMFPYPNESICSLHGQ